MKQTKENRIKRFKKQRIWPSLLGLFIITLIFAMMLVLVIINSAQDLVKRKIKTGLSQTEPIVELFKEYNEENKQDIGDRISIYIDMMTDTEAVYVSDINGSKIWSNGEKIPDVENVEEIYFTDKEHISLIVEDDTAKILLSDDISDVIASDLDIDAVFDDGLYGDKKLIQLKIWYLQEIDNLNVYVLQNISLYHYDCYMILSSVVLFGVIIAIFILYYLISFISVIIGSRRTAKAIYTDMTTGGNNWLYFVKKGNKFLKRKLPSNKYAVIHLKMRKYRSFCTCFGVKEGEVLIERLYNVLKKQIKHKELMVYKENATFGLLLSYTDEQQLTERIEMLTSNLNSVLLNMKLYFSAGIYRVYQRETDIEQLYNNAVLACDMLGDELENKIVFYDVEMNNRRLWERKVEDDMYRALANHEFQVYLQPKISAAKESLAGAEALVRWIHPQEGFIPPNRFIPIFERNGFILNLDDYMLEEIARQQAQWISQGRNVVPISVNVSRAHFTKEDLAEHICGIVDKYQVPHNVIELELTESAFFDDKQVLLQTVKKLREAGFIVSMDDFGAGYSSLNSLKELQLDVLKIDADFFRGADAEERGMLIVSEVIDLAKKLNMKIVAEGIESREQVDFLAEQECDLIQGYFFAKPMPISEFEQKYSDML